MEAEEANNMPKVPRPSGEQREPRSSAGELRSSQKPLTSDACGSALSQLLPRADGLIQI